MKDIFSELYKKVMSFFNNEIKEENSKDTACNRLKLVLMQDRAKMEPALMEKMREEMIEVISKYVEIDKEALDLNLEAEGESFALMLNIPVLRAKTREEIEAEEGIVIKDEDDDEEDIVDDDEVDEDKVEESEDDAVKPGETESKAAEETKNFEEKEEDGEEDSSLNNVSESSDEHDEKPSASVKKEETIGNVTNQPPSKKKKHQKDDDL